RPDEVDRAPEPGPVRRAAVQPLGRPADRRAGLQRGQVPLRPVTLRSPSAFEQPLRLARTQGTEDVDELPTSPDQRLLHRRRILGHDYSLLSLAAAGSLLTPTAAAATRSVETRRRPAGAAVGSTAVTDRNPGTARR